MNTFLTLQTVDAVLEHINALQPLEGELLPLVQAAGRTLAEAYHAPEDLPGFARSTMDGFAVQARDVFGASEGMPALLDLVGECVMGEAPSLVLESGQTARIWTGGMLPQGADAVVMLEYSRTAGTHQVELTKPVAPGDNTLAKDEDVQQGMSLLPAGLVLQAQDMGLLAALGQEEILVRRKPRLAVISTGDEILPQGAALMPGKIRESNSMTLLAMIAHLGGEGKYLGLVVDDLATLTAKVEQGLEEADAVLVTGGSSAGQRDFTLAAFASLPGWEVLVHGIAMRPGKPTILARKGNKTLWGLPGNPTAAFITAHIFIRRLIQVLLGQSLAPPVPGAAIHARLSRRLSSAQGRRDFIRVVLEPGTGPEDFLPMAVPLLGPSGLVSNPVNAHGLIVCHEDQEGLDAGERVEVQLLRPLCS